MLFAQTVPFAKYFSNTLANSSFDIVKELNNQSGYIMLGTRYTTQPNIYFIKTDTALNRVWSKRFTLLPPYSNASFRDIGEFPTGEYYMLGMTSSGYIIFVLDTNGVVLHETIINETTHTASAGWFGRSKICPDSSLLISTAEYEWAGFYRFDNQLNLLSAGFSQASPNQNTSGNACIMLSSQDLLYSAVSTTGAGIVKSTKQGVMLWSKFYFNIGNVFSLHEGSGGSVYMGGGNANPNLTKVDSAGNLLWTRSYTTPLNNLGTAVIRNIFPMTNGNLLLFTDSLFFEADTSGNPVSVSYVLPQHYSLGEMRAAGPDFLFCSVLYHGGPPGDYPTVMRFHTPAGSICLWPRQIIMSNGSSMVNSGAGVTAMSPQFIQQSVPHIDTLSSFDYDPLPGCPNHPLSLEEKPVSSSVLLAFPNPANDEIRFELAAPYKGTLTTTVSDFSGRVVFSGELKREDIRLSVSGFPGGIYFARVYDDNGYVAVTRFCVIH
ncbi:MAG: hypothetical protein FD123_1084 [Bacteroidetes bacterium]|nr:MAG: hypothetical protein FD123_1084 [Bacteroidota bacterium]